jgi:hypothetical protein
MRGRAHVPLSLRPLAHSLSPGLQLSAGTAGKYRERRIRGVPLVESRARPRRAWPAARRRGTNPATVATWRARSSRWKLLSLMRLATVAAPRPGGERRRSRAALSCAGLLVCVRRSFSGRARCSARWRRSLLMDSLTAAGLETARPPVSLQRGPQFRAMSCGAGATLPISALLKSERRQIPSELAGAGKGAGARELL